MKLKDILNKLEEFESNEEKLEYLKKLLNKLKDDILIEDVKDLIEELEENLETKLEDIAITPRRMREIESEDVEIDLEAQERQVARQTIRRPDLNLRNVNLEEENEVRYEATNPNYKPITSTPIYQSVQPFSNYNNLALQNQLNIRMVEEILIKEREFNVGQVISDVQREEIRDTIERFIPNASVEEKIRAEQQVMYEMKFKNKDLKYITRLK